MPGSSSTNPISGVVRRVVSRGYFSMRSNLTSPSFVAKRIVVSYDSIHAFWSILNQKRSCKLQSLTIYNIKFRHVELNLRTNKLRPVGTMMNKRLSIIVEWILAQPQEPIHKQQSMEHKIRINNVQATLVCLKPMPLPQGRAFRDHPILPTQLLCRSRSSLVSIYLAVVLTAGFRSTNGRENHNDTPIRNFFKLLTRAMMIR